MDELLTPATAGRRASVTMARVCIRRRPRRDFFFFRACSTLDLLIHNEKRAYAIALHAQNRDAPQQDTWRGSRLLPAQTGFPHLRGGWRGTSCPPPSASPLRRACPPGMPCAQGEVADIWMVIPSSSVKHRP